MTPLAPQTCHLLSVEGTIEEFLAPKSKKSRHEFDRRRRKVFRELPGTRFERITEFGQVKKFLDQVDVVYADSWQARTFGYRPRNTERECTMLEWVARKGWLRSYLLTCSQQPLSYHIAYQYRGICYLSEKAFASAYASYDPGLVETLLIFEDLFKENSPHTVDFGFGDLDFKRRFSNRSYEGCPVYVLRPNRYMLLLHAQRFINSVCEKIRSALIATRLDRVVRRLVKHKA